MPLLNLLGFGERLTMIGFVWYNFNVICIAGTVYLMFQTSIARARRAVVNQSELESKTDKATYRLIIFTGIFAICYFIFREHVSTLKDIWVWFYNLIESLIKWLQDLMSSM